MISTENSGAIGGTQHVFLFAGGM